MTQTPKDSERTAPTKPIPQPRKRRPLGIMLVGALTAIGGVALLLVE